MIISRTPFRVSFFGGGSDLKDYYLKQTGAVLSTTINKYMYVSAHPYFNRKQTNLKYAKTECVDDISQIQHPIIRETLNLTKITGGIEITSTADIPAGTGLGSSSSFTVGLLNTLNQYVGKESTKKELAEKACEIEIEKIKDPIGKQDQYAAAFGGFNKIEFHPDEQVKVKLINIKPKTLDELGENILMFYTKKTRKANEILTDQSNNLRTSGADKIQKEMVDLVYQAYDYIKNDDLTSFGQLLDETWQMKKKLSQKISDPQIDLNYGKAIKTGALGGKLLGAGGGGFLLFYCEKEKQESLRKELNNLYELEFNFEHQGSKIIYVGEKEAGHKNGFFE